MYGQYFSLIRLKFAISLCLPRFDESLLLGGFFIVFKKKVLYLDSLLCNLNKLQYIVFLFVCVCFVLFLFGAFFFIIKFYKLQHQSQQLVYKLQTLYNHMVVLPKQLSWLRFAMVKHFEMIFGFLFD